ncbi:hypothetical protein [Alkalihalobacillus sp. 1P02AB]|uniref:hypothetical protein n=1 Tax=Alkalihalobacillus sp. 1P02AB TaxID=3132260 RepID=UPI0039A6F4E0
MKNFIFIWRSFILLSLFTLFLANILEPMFFYSMISAIFFFHTIPWLLKKWTLSHERAKSNSP